MKKNITRTPTLFSLIVKCAAAAVFALFLFSLAVYTVQTVATDDFGATDADYISWCEANYLERDFTRLYEELQLFELYGEHYALYREAAEGYKLLTLALQHAKSMDAALPDAAAAYDAVISELAAMAEAPQHERNAQLLAEFLAEAESFRPETAALPASP